MSLLRAVPVNIHTYTTTPIHLDNEGFTALELHNIDFLIYMRAFQLSFRCSFIVQDCRNQVPQYALPLLI